MELLCSLRVLTKLTLDQIEMCQPPHCSQPPSNLKELWLEHSLAAKLWLNTLSKGMPNLTKLHLLDCELLETSQDMEPIKSLR